MKTQASKWFTELGATNLLGNLYGRWLDECQYEDIADYGKVLSASAAPFGLVITKMTKRPWGCQFHDPSTGAKYALKVSGSSASYVKV